MATLAALLYLGAALAGASSRVRAALDRWGSLPARGTAHARFRDPWCHHRPPLRPGRRRGAAPPGHREDPRGREPLRRGLLGHDPRPAGPRLRVLGASRGQSHPAAPRLPARDAPRHAPRLPGLARALRLLRPAGRDPGLLRPRHRPGVSPARSGRGAAGRRGGGRLQPPHLVAADLRRERRGLRRHPPGRGAASAARPGVWPRARASGWPAPPSSWPGRSLRSCSRA